MRHCVKLAQKLNSFIPFQKNTCRQTMSVAHGVLNQMQVTSIELCVHQ